MTDPPRSSRLKRFGRRLGLLAASLVVAGVLAEAVVLLIYGEQPKFPRHVVAAGWGLRYNTPGARYRHKSADVCVQFRINAQGMRADADVAYDKPAGTLRIVSLGDSFTIGYEVSAEQTFSAVLQRELTARGYRVEILNAGISGFSTAEECLYLERELLKYHPDLVLVSFCANDLVDNVRTGLFRLEGDTLVAGADHYVPLGATANWLNRSGLFNLLSERSNAFVWAKERTTLMLKKEMVEANEQALAAKTQPDAAVDFQRRLAAAILDRMYTAVRDNGATLLIQRIPLWTPADNAITDTFPETFFDGHRPGLAVLEMKPILEAQPPETLLYWRRSHGHWTPEAHRLSGKALADMIVEKKLLPAP